NQERRRAKVLRGLACKLVYAKTVPGPKQNDFIAFRACAGPLRADVWAGRSTHGESAATRSPRRSVAATSANRTVAAAPLKKGAPAPKAEKRNPENTGPSARASPPADGAKPRRAPRWRPPA